MIEAGHPWFAEARGKLLRHIDADGTFQSDLANRAGMSKQAIQQHVDRLEAELIVKRVADPKDARRVRVILSPVGEQVMADADRIKLDLAARIAERMGNDRFESLANGLRVFLGTDI